MCFTWDFFCGLETADDVFALELQMVMNMSFTGSSRSWARGLTLQRRYSDLWQIQPIVQGYGSISLIPGRHNGQRSCIDTCCRERISGVSAVVKITRSEFKAAGSNYNGLRSESTLHNNHLSRRWL
ncbi:predicted protein [Histoplasma capsulatum var. duboisii H88]|uniref:Predicted protein n=1 Tax=Ajellomyces capsulatus (strain H88) TaxID=544711 RepID=F0UIK5_AJEC8|nr:predicted protein [Histoplasma capsulatum var. duboisii H88]